MIATIPAEQRFALVDMPWVAGAAIGLTLIAAFMGGIPRLAGAALLVVYGAHVALLM